MENLFDIAAYPDNWKVKFATCYLKGEVDLSERQLRMSEINLILIGESLQVFIRKKFYSDSVCQQKEKEFLDL